jgi:hypothetical protein
LKSTMNTTCDLKPLLLFPVPKVINLAMFQLVWVTTVFGVAHDRLWPGMAILSFFLIINTTISATARVDLTLATIAVTLGAAIDTVFIRAGLLSFEMNLPWLGFAPIWILILWANFALILNNGLQWMQGHYKIAAILGFIGGPLSYLGGIGLGAGELHVAPLTAFLIIGSCWAIVTPLLLMAARELTRRTAKS